MHGTMRSGRSQLWQFEVAHRWRGQRASNARAGHPLEHRSVVPFVAAALHATSAEVLRRCGRGDGDGREEENSGNEIELHRVAIEAGDEDGELRRRE